jgi:hypothetical protein
LEEEYKMGVERAVTLWYVQRQCILNEIALLEAKVAQTSVAEPGASNAVEEEAPDIAAIEEQLAKAQEKLRSLGPCPKPMMG